MALDNAQFISELSITDPPGTDPLSQGDDQIRTAKRAVFQSFPNVDAQVDRTAAELNDVALLSAANIFTGSNTFTSSGAGAPAIVIEAAAPGFNMRETDQILDEKNWVMRITGGELQWGTADDAAPGSVASSALTIVRTGTFIDNVRLHAGAGLRRLVTQVSGAAGLLSDGNTDTEPRQLLFQHQDGTLRGFTGYGGDDIIRLENRINSGNLLLTGRNGAGLPVTFLDGDPDATTVLRGGTNVNIEVNDGVNFAITCEPTGPVTTYFNGIARSATAAGGLLAIRSDTNTDTETRRLDYQHQDGTLRALVGHDAGGTFDVQNRINGGILGISAFNGSGVTQFGFILDPTARTTVGASGLPLRLQGTQQGFFGSDGTAKPTITGAKGANEALTSLIPALAAMGLITDSTTL